MDGAGASNPRFATSMRSRYFSINRKSLHRNLKSRPASVTSKVSTCPSICDPCGLKGDYEIFSDDDSNNRKHAENKSIKSQLFINKSTTDEIQHKFELINKENAKVQLRMKSLFKNIIKKDKIISELNKINSHLKQQLQETVNHSTIQNTDIIEFANVNNRLQKEIEKKDEEITTLQSKINKSEFIRSNLLKDIDYYKSELNTAKSESLSQRQKYSEHEYEKLQKKFFEIKIENSKLCRKFKEIRSTDEENCPRTQSYHVLSKKYDIVQHDMLKLKMENKKLKDKIRKNKHLYDDETSEMIRNSTKSMSDEIENLTQTKHNLEIENQDIRMLLEKVEMEAKNTKAILANVQGELQENRVYCRQCEEELKHFKSLCSDLQNQLKVVTNEKKDILRQYRINEENNNILKLKFDELMREKSKFFKEKKDNATAMTETLCENCVLLKNEIEKLGYTNLRLNKAKQNLQTNFQKLSIKTSKLTLKMEEMEQERQKANQRDDRGTDENLLQQNVLLSKRLHNLLKKSEKLFKAHVQEHAKSEKDIVVSLPSNDKIIEELNENLTFSKVSSISNKLIENISKRESFKMFERDMKPVTKYISCIRIKGVPILSPLITHAKRKEIHRYKQQAIKLEKRLKRERELRQYIDMYYTPNIENYTNNIITTSLEHRLSFEDDLTSQIADIEHQIKEMKDSSTVNELPSTIQKKTPCLSCDLQVSQYANNEFMVLTKFEKCKSNIVTIINDSLCLEESDSVSAKENSDNDIDVLSTNNQRSRLIRSNSYTLESPSPLLLEHLRRQSESIDLSDERKTLPKVIVDKIENVKELDASPNNDVTVTSHIQEHHDNLDDSNFTDFSTTESELRNISTCISDQICNNEDFTVVEGQYQLKEFIDNNVPQMLHPQEIQTEIAKEKESYFCESNKDCSTCASNLSITELGNLNVTSSKKQLGEYDEEYLKQMLSTIPEIYSKQIMGLLEKQKQELFKMKNSQDARLCTTESNYDQIKNRKFTNFEVVKELHNNVALNCSRELFPSCDIKRSLRNIEDDAASVINAAVKGFLIRRLMKTDRVQGLIQTIRDALICAMQLHSETSDCINESDVELHRRLIQQVSAACYEFHDVFFALTTSEQMAIIRVDRERQKEKLKRPLSRASSAGKSSRSSVQFVEKLVLVLNEVPPSDRNTRSHKEVDSNVTHAPQTERKNK
ncbi:centriolar coiled-coil protein [Holotrichia oblita]|uniref:Centriolar coiled-coil protein n=1 Tax=Holotrichia oblita TaxID=644536 RepID=A0ACB9TT92_HOLOL|nr:centriolar coiled-coil protein [Holotrichia oblita]